MVMLKILDSKNYSNDMPKIIRHAVRGIIFKENKIAMIRSKYGDYKFPGGGMENEESEIDTLCREVQEETGLCVIEESCRPIGEVLELRRDRYEEKIFEHHSYYYFCDVSDEVLETNKSVNEINYGYELAWVSLQEVYNANMTIPEIEKRPWVYRDTLVIKMLIDNKIT